ncbi:hypothetical protein ACFFX0_00335 [Citricoccus parietis]|uniref:Uncharacterized protein n=1 Tax=Citricoccus parietis TaxID=592307 RepID=A0ABV5FSR4_9MICC
MLLQFSRARSVSAEEVHSSNCSVASQKMICAEATNPNMAQPAIAAAVAKRRTQGDFTWAVRTSATTPQMSPARAKARETAFHGNVNTDDR